MFVGSLKEFEVSVKIVIDKDFFRKGSISNFYGFIIYDMLILFFVICILVLMLRFLFYILRVHSEGRVESVEELDGEADYYRDSCEHKETLL